MRSSRRLAPALLCAAAVLSACGGSGGGSGGGTAAAAAAPTVYPASPTRSAREQVQEPDSAASAVLELWNDLRVRAVPLAASAYQPAVRRRLGLPALTSVLASQIPVVQSRRPTILDARTTPLGTLVLLRAEGPTGPAQEHAYLMRRQGDEWFVVYDSLVGESVNDVVTNTAQSQIDPRAKVPSGRARQAGVTAADQFRTGAFGDDAAE